MKKTFQKTLIAAAAGVALMSAVGTASANSLLFPYFTTATGAQSVLSISSNSTTGSASSSGVEALHYVYNYGPTCTHFDGFGGVTANDLMQHSIAAPAAGGFGKAVATDASLPFYFPLAGYEGFLTVSTRTTSGAQISGELSIVDPASGMVASYAGIDNALDTSIATNEGNFTGITDQKFNLSFYGASVTATRWFGVAVGDMSGRIAAGRNWNGSQTITNNGVVYNNDESPLSGTSAVRITCAGSFAPTALMSTATAAALGNNGGLIHATATGNATDADGNAISPTTGLVLVKLQTVQAAVGAPFAGKLFMHREGAPAF